ncbi:MAG: MFS transporter [Verrucomicrobia bacterium]|nr:MFS transporter [Verrucomicrobiota bacterium]MBI3871152.1 MFS transporter [Verrucomicrobiota bacterium]
MRHEPQEPQGKGPSLPAAGTRRIPKSSVVGWVLYDLANTIFSMGVISMTFPLWVRDAVGAENADKKYGFISAISMGIVFLMSPLLGAMTDRAPRRLPFLTVSTLICVGLTAMLGRGGFGWTALMFILANIAYQAGTQFYDSLLPEVSTESNRGRIGGIGVGIGYLGSFVAVALSQMLDERPKSTLFLAYGASFLAFSLPCMLCLRERGNPNPKPLNLQAAIASVAETVRTIRSSQEYPGLLRFLIGRMFYTDAINTVISVMALFVMNVAMTSGLERKEGEGQVTRIMVCAITFAVVGGFVWGALNDRLGPKKTLSIVLISWMGILIFAGLIGVMGWPLWTMYVMGSLAGFCLGGVWSADRPFMLRLTPPDRVGEFYGLYGMVGRFSAITGPLIWGTATHFIVQWQSGGKAATGELQQAQWARVAQGGAVVALLGMVLVGFLILRAVSDQPVKREA